MSLRLGPDSARYMIAAQGRPVARPFHLRWLLPAVCGTSPIRWWWVWALSWPILGGGIFWLASDLGWQRALFAAVVCMALPGVWGPSVVRPVGVDLPAMALGACGAAAASHGVWWLAVLLVGVASMIKESAPVWAALWAWHPALLACLVLPAFWSVIRRPEIDEVTARPELREIHDQPVRTALKFHQGRWRDAWLMVWPWGACLAALYHPTWQVAAVIVVAHLQLLIATDTNRLTHTAAGPVLAIAAASVLPLALLPLIAAAHVFWWRTPEVV